MLVLILSHPLQEFNHTVDRNTTDWGRTSVLSIKKINKIQKKKNIQLSWVLNQSEHKRWNWSECSLFYFPVCFTVRVKKKVRGRFWTPWHFFLWRGLFVNLFIFIPSGMGNMTQRGNIVFMCQPWELFSDLNLTLRSGVIWEGRTQLMRGFLKVHPSRFEG